VITLSPLATALYIQLLVIFALLNGWLYFRLRRLKRRRQSDEMENATGGERADTSTAHYLATEIKLTRGRLESLYPEGVPPEPELTEADLLSLRDRYLGLEAELLQDTAREDVFWKRLAEGIRRLLTDCHLVKRMPVTETGDGDEAEDETAELRALVKQQQEELERFLSTLDEDDGELGPEELKKRLTTLASSHRELSHCIFSLEDENHFLREQVASLLKHG